MRTVDGRANGANGAAEVKVAVYVPSPLFNMVREKGLCTTEVSSSVNHAPAGLPFTREFAGSALAGLLDHPLRTVPVTNKLCATTLAINTKRATCRSHMPSMFPY